MYSCPNSVRNGVQYFHKLRDKVKNCVTSDLEEQGEFSHWQFTIVLQDKKGAEKPPCPKFWRRQEGRNKDLNSSVLAVPVTIKMGPSKVRNQAKPLTILGKKLFLTDLEQMLQRTASDLDIHPTMNHQRLSFALKNARLLLPQRYGK
jgi:hypothetical protein